MKVILKKGKGESLKRFHPWVFSGAVNRIEGCPSEGNIVDVYSFEGDFLGRGHYQKGSITVRILSFEKRAIDDVFWYEMLRKAYDMRNTLGLITPDTNSYRLVHGEGDNLPGLVIDIYDNVAVLQAHSAGMYVQRNKIAQALLRIYGEQLKAVYNKSEGTAPFKAGLDLADGYLYIGESDAVLSDILEKGETVAMENGNKFYVNWIEGQKTGFFLDQRDNRALVGKFVRDKRVLNLFCYTGGFSVYALMGGASCVDSVDSSSKAIELLERNVALNFGADASSIRHNSFCCDAIEYMRNCEVGKYDLIIVDPPAFAKHRDVLDNALRAYKKLNASAIEKVAPGGIVFTYSCSQVVDKSDFALAVFSAAAMAKRKVRILYRLTQPADHPVNIYHPEGEYLKGLVLYVE